MADNPALGRLSQEDYGSEGTLGYTLKSKRRMVRDVSQLAECSSSMHTVLDSISSTA